MGIKIKDYRKKQSMTQEELSQKSGVSRSTIIALENGSKKNVNTATLLKIARALDTTVENIFFGENV